MSSSALKIIIPKPNLGHTFSVPQNAIHKTLLAHVTVLIHLRFGKVFQNVYFSLLVYWIILYLLVRFDMILAV